MLAQQFTLWPHSRTVVGLNRGPAPCLEAGSLLVCVGFPPAAVDTSHYMNL